MARRSDQKFDTFISKNIDLVSEYDSISGVPPFESCKYEVLEKFNQLSKTNKGLSFNVMLRDALSTSILSQQSILDSLDNFAKQQVQESRDVNVTQAYFREIGEIYKKNKNNYNIEYCEENRDKLISMNLKTVVSVAKQFQGLGLSLNDLISAGNLGLCVAWEKFDPKKAKLKDDVLQAVSDIGETFTYDDLIAKVEQFFTYGNIREKLDEKFKDDKEHTNQELHKWIDKNIFNAKFSSIAVMWITAYIRMELDNCSRLVKKPKSEIYKDKEQTGAYKKEVLLNLDQPIANDTDTTFADTLSMEDDTESEMTITEAYDEYKAGLNKLLDGVPTRDRAVILKKFGIGLPRPLLPREIADQENLSIARISQIVQVTMDKMRKNCVKYDIDIQQLLNACQKFR